MLGLTRGMLTLVGVAAAVVLIWTAAQVGDDSTADYWALYGLVAAAGLVMALSQLLGGWTKWGTPTMSPGVFLLAFLPTLVVVGGILVATRPTDTEEGDQVAGWIRDIGLGGVAEDLIVFQGVLAFALGIVFAFTFDTRGPRSRTLERETVVPDEDVQDYRDEVVSGDEETVVVRRYPE